MISDFGVEAASHRCNILVIITTVEILFNDIFIAHQSFILPPKLCIN